MASTSSPKKPAVYREVCGTTAGWNQHQVNNEEKDDACLAAKAKYQQKWRLETGRTRYKLVPLEPKEES